ncbi:unnamed protein product [Phytophthora fragariaefolia]|uniref:Unnamed protein product n=1 Tax=Phytophthora fragariaefolia TaxID=1490495 RepID=A0A9W6TNW4_9STRA|nr:unnamed protein product [Phytophthora fragariaefolia]
MQQSRLSRARPTCDSDRVSSEQSLIDGNDSHRLARLDLAFGYSGSMQHDTSACMQPSAVQDTVGSDYFVAEDGAFLDAVAAALTQLSADCSSALRWSYDDNDALAAIHATEQSLSAIASICKEAGLIVNDELLAGHRGPNRWDLESNTSQYAASSCSPPGSMRSSWPNELDTSRAEFYYNEVTHPPPAPIERITQLEPRQGTTTLNPTEEIVEVELTDLMAQSHEEMISLQRAFEARMSKADQSREEYERKHAVEMQSLQQELASSRLAMDRIKHELLDSTTRKLEDMHLAIMASHNAVEAGMKDQARYWKSICEELVIEKRGMAQKVAEERGKYTALKAHLAGHDDATARPLSSSHVRTNLARGDDSAVIGGVSELLPLPVSPPLAPGKLIEEPGPCDSVCGTPPDSSLGLVVVPDADCISEASSAEVSPTPSSSSSTSRTGKPTAFRRYYLAPKRVALQ